MLPVLLDAATEAAEASVTTLDIIIIVGVIAAVVLAYFYFTKKPAPPVIKQSYSTKGITTKKDVPTKAEVKGPPVTILFGSQSGTAETFAYELAKEAKTHGFSPKVVDLEEYNHEDDLADEKFVCFLMATFGEGEPTDSAQNFYKWLMDGERDTSSMSSVEYAVFALGNRQYEHYCLVGRKVSSRMAELGATEILEHGEGDDDGSLEDDYAAWRVKFWEAAKAKYGGVETAPAKFEPTIAIKWVETKSVSPTPEESKEEEEQDFVMVDPPGKEARIPSVVMDPKHKGGFATVTDNIELRQDASTGSTRHIEIDISGMPFVYRTADNLGVFPRNDYKLVAKIARRLGVSPKSVFHLEHRGENQRKLPFPSPCTVQDALLWYCDLTSIPKRALLEILQQYATDATDKAKLAQFIHDGKAAYLEDQKHLLEVLEEVPSVKIPFADFLEICPKLIPRYYTISSSARHQPDRVSLTVVVARADKPRGRVHQGVCSTYLAQLVPFKDKVAVFCRDSTFRPTWELPVPGSPKAGDKSNPLANIRQNCAPMIMIGPGTGVAPFRGFLQEASLLVKSGAKIGDILLFFGCQRQDKDYLYKEEFNKYQEEGIVRLITAFSRETKHKVYVQHRLLEHGPEVWDLIQNKGASIFLCGATTMGTDVRNTLAEIFQKHGGKTQKEATDLVQSLQTQKRLIQELWG